MDCQRHSEWMTGKELHLIREDELISSLSLLANDDMFLLVSPISALVMF